MGRAKKSTPQNLSEKLRLIRVKLELTTEELIKKLGCPDIRLYRASISQYESGKIEPPLPVLLSYGKLANIYVDVLIDDELELPETIPSQEKSDGIRRN